MTATDQTSSAPARDRIHEIAAREGITYVPDPCDALADAITAHAGDEVELDETQHLLMALQRAGAVSPSSATFLHSAYLDERDA